MNLDLFTLMIVTGLVIVLSGVFFVLNTVIGSSDLTGRLWSTTFMMAMLGVIALSAWAVMPSAWWVFPISNASLIISVGFAWAGARTFNARPSWLAIPLCAAAAAIVVTIVEFPIHAEWAGSSTMFAAVSLFALLTAIESSRGLLGKRLNGRILAAVTATAAAFYGVRFVMFYVWGPRSEQFTNYLGADVTTLVVTLLVLGAALSMSILQAERGLSSNSWRRDASAAFSRGVLEWRAFLSIAGDRVDRVAEHNEQSAVIVGHLDNLPEINLAFGRQFGDEAIAGFARLMRAELPSTAIIGHRGAGRMVAIAIVATPDEARAMASRLLSALVDSPLENSRGGFRLSASFGVSHSVTTPHALTVLLTEADAACDRAREAGGNGVALSAGYVRPATANFATPEPAGDEAATW